MKPDIQLCVSQQLNDVPYVFKVTGLHVFSFEEVLFHVFHYWRQSVDDFLSDELIGWVNDTLGLSYLSARMKELAKIDEFSRRMLAFLRLIDYFNDEELNSLQKELKNWEKRREWEKLKERADYLMGRGEPDTALMLYRRALAFEENTAILNNMGVAFMQSEAYEEAYRCLSRALALDRDNIDLMLHLSEAAVFCHRYDDARRILERAARPGHDATLDPGRDLVLDLDNRLKNRRADILFLYGALHYEQGDYPRAIRYFEQAIGMNGLPEPYFVYRLSDVYVKMRQYDKALTVLDQVSVKDIDFYVKQAELYSHADNIPAAVKSMQKALVQKNNDAGLWMKLAMYHRLDYDLNMANAAITKALAIDPENDRVRLENARIKKGMGRTREYQAVLNNVLRGFRQKYRELVAGVDAG